jgi:hypothetical protein
MQNSVTPVYRSAELDSLRNLRRPPLSQAGLLHDQRRCSSISIAHHKGRGSSNFTAPAFVNARHEIGFLGREQQHGEAHVATLEERVLAESSETLPGA